MNPLHLAFLAPLLLGGVPDPTWRLYTDADAAFQIEIPGDFQHQKDTIETSVGTMTYHRYSCFPKDTQSHVFHYTVHYSRYPSGTIPRDSVELVNDLLNETVESTAGNLDAVVLYSDRITLEDKFQGAFWRMDLKDGKAVVKSKAYFVDDRFYLLQAFYWPERHKNVESERFFDSFKLLHQ